LRNNSWRWWMVAIGVVARNFIIRTLKQPVPFRWTQSEFRTQSTFSWLPNASIPLALTLLCLSMYSLWLLITSGIRWAPAPASLGTADHSQVQCLVYTSAFSPWIQPLWG
jgi:hypothetical protein